ncbi:Holliday junction resolvasome RuvABC endonuclease subunit [Paenibacillus turicensis]|uniref:Holliday junction resolvasome RuvABC endonuclease subunit n=1 Tax=Paenibacillus turicensis TaxID=160487 RepID=A0ABS4FUQ8_9BACL|nr:crossover junction endodeoxyribonuclease RuvC [Paenibacillus turicensis]MBP1906316.1 Holliday junction resolvasome RuvABC endonuclease subunit [Paenibacillus turicensis]
MRILFCDQSLLRFGFCLVELKEDYCEVINYGLLQLNGKIHYIERLIQIESWLVNYLRKHDIEQLVVEEIQFQRNVQTFRKLCVLQYVMEALCYKNSILYAKPLQVHVWRTNGVRKLLHLSNGSKMTLYEHLNRRLNYPDSFDTNQADAIGMAQYWCAQNTSIPFVLDNAKQIIIKDKGIC